MWLINRHYAADVEDRRRLLVYINIPSPSFYWVVYSRHLMVIVTLIRLIVVGHITIILCTCILILCRYYYMYINYLGIKLCF